MKLVGNFLSPCTRRVAISLDALAMPYDMETLFVFKSPDIVANYNALVRIPVLILDDAEVLIDSQAILDEIDQIAGPTRALVPPAGKSRRKVMQLTAMAHGAMEKAQAAFYEGREGIRPAKKVHKPWIQHNEKQLVGALSHLDEVARAAGTAGWLGGTAKMSQADISSAVAFTFADAVRPNLSLAEMVPDLAGFAARCEALDIFNKSPLPKDIR